PHIHCAPRVRIIDEADVLDRDSERGSELDQPADAFALDGVVEEDHQLRLDLERFAQRLNLGGSASNDSSSVAIFAYWFLGDNVDMRLVMAVIGADLEGEERLLEREIGADDQDGILVVEIDRSRERRGLATHGVKQ